MNKSIKRPIKILVLSRNYPNNILERLGLWVQRIVHHCADNCELKVISPVPYCPPLPAPRQYKRFRQVQRQRLEDRIEVFHPRFCVGPGRSLYYTEAVMYYLAVRPLVDRLRRRFSFDLIHAHFSYPDGVAAAALGERYRVPVVITEHAPWRPNWMDKSMIVRSQTVWAARKSAFLITVSHSVKDTIVHFTGELEKVRVIPNGVDGSEFTPFESEAKPKPNQILYVGVINFNKGIDVLLKAMRLLVRKKPDVKLILVGGSFYRKTRLQEEQLHRMAIDLGLGGHVEFAGMKSPAEVARCMGESALLVLPSRAESFGSVLVEALACGIPVVATRCGGPEDIVDEKVGVLIPKEDVNALAGAIAHVLDHRDEYDARKLRTFAIENFAWERIARRTVELYNEVFESQSDRDIPIPGNGELIYGKLEEHGA